MLDKVLLLLTIVTKLYDFLEKIFKNRAKVRRKKTRKNPPDADR